MGALSQTAMIHHTIEHILYRVTDHYKQEFQITELVYGLGMTNNTTLHMQLILVWYILKMENTILT